MSFKKDSHKRGHEKIHASHRQHHASSLSSLHLDHVEPFKKLGATKEQVYDGRPHNDHHIRPDKTYPIMQGRGTQDTYFHEPLAFGPNFKHTLAGKKHFKTGGHARGEVIVEYGTLSPKGQRAASGKWIQNALPPSSKGKLHAHLGIPQGQKIPLKKIKKAEHSSNPTLAREAHLADTLRKFHH